MAFKIKFPAFLFALELMLIVFMPLVHAETVVPITIGVAGNFSGGSDSTNNQWNKYIYPAAELAVLRFRSRDPNLAQRVRIIKLDYAGKKDKVLDVVNEAVGAGVLAIVGFDQSEYAEIAARQLEQLGIPLITHSATADRITKDRTFIFRACFTNSSAASYFAKFAREKLFISTIIALPESTCLYCSDLNQHFAVAYTALGGNFIEVASDVRGNYDWESVKSFYEKQKAGKKIAFFVPNHEGSSGKVVRQLLLLFKDPLVLGGDGWGDTGQLFFKIIGQQSFSGYKWAHWSIDQNSTALQNQFISEFSRRAGVKPVESSALMYDAMSLLLNSLKNSSQISRRGIRDALANTDNFNGVTGKISLNEANRMDKSPLFQHVEQGSFKAATRDDIK